MRVLERIYISRDAGIMLVQIGRRYIAVSSSKDGLRFLCELSPADLNGADNETAPADTAPRVTSPSDNYPDNSSLGKRFIHNMKINAGLLPKDTPPARPPVKNTPQSGPSSFALELLRAQADGDKDGLLELLGGEARNAERPESSVAEPQTKTPDYQAAIDSLKQMSNTETPAVTAASAAAALYKNTVSNLPGNTQRASAPAAPAKAVSPAPVREPNNDDLDELFDRIEKRNNRYSKKGERK